MQPNKLKDCAETLKNLRQAHHSQLDTSTLAELDNVIAELERVQENSKREVKLEEVGLVAFRALRVIDTVIRLVSNITDWLQ